MIYTASFFDPEEFGTGTLVSIALAMPENFMYLHSDRKVVINEKLQPNWGMVNSKRAGIISTEAYKKQYFRLLKERLGRVDWHDLLNGKLGAEDTLRVLDLHDGDALLCWEKYGQFCHRILVAELLKNNGILVSRR